METGFLCDTDLGLGDVRRFLAEALGLAADQVSAYDSSSETLLEVAKARAHCTCWRHEGQFPLEVMVSFPDSWPLKTFRNMRALIRRFSDLSGTICALGEGPHPVWICFEPGQPVRFLIEADDTDDEDAKARFEPYVPGPNESGMVRDMIESVEREKL